MPDPNDRRLIKGATVVVEPDGAVRDINTSRALRYAYKTGDRTIFYFAVAEPYHVAPLDSAAVWQIAQLNSTTGKIDYADFAQYNQIWNNREALVYG